MKVIIINFILVFSLQAAIVDKSWFQLPEESVGNSKVIFNKVNKSTSSLDDFSSLESIVSAHENALGLPTRNDEKGFSNWYLKGFETNLALSLSGKLGPLAWGGGKAIVLEWYRKNQLGSQKDLEEKILYNSPAETNFSENSTPVAIETQLEPVIKALVYSGKVQNEQKLRKNLMEVGIKFLSAAKGLGTIGKTQWFPGKIWADISVSASGNIGVAAIGSNITVRLQFVRLSKQSDGINKPFDQNLNDSQLRTRQLLTGLAHDMSVAVEKAEKKKNSVYKIKAMRVGLGMNAGGEVALVKGAVDFKLMVFYFRNEKTVKFNTELTHNEVTPLIVTNNLSQTEGYADQVGIIYKKIDNVKTVFNVPRKKLRKGLEKAIKFGHKFSNKLTKSKNKNSKWGVKVIKSVYKISVGGSLGVANVSANPTFMFLFVNTEF